MRFAMPVALAAASFGVAATARAEDPKPAPVRLRPVLRPTDDKPAKPSPSAAKPATAPAANNDNGRYVSVFDLESSTLPGEEIDLEITGETLGSPASELSFEVGETPPGNDPPANDAASPAADAPPQPPDVPRDDPPAGVLAEAESLRADGRSEEARALLLAFESEHPEDPLTPDAALAAARIAAESEAGLDMAMEELQRLVVRHPGTPAAHKALLDIGEFAQIAGDYERALRSYGAIRLVETSPALARQNSIQIAQTLMLLERYGQAVLEYDTLLREHPGLAERSDIAINLADAVLATGDYERAEALFEEAAGRFADPAVRGRALLHQGLCLEMLGQPSRARAVYDGLIAAWPDGPERGPAEKRLADLDQPLLP